MTPDSETSQEASNWPVAVLAVLGVLFMLYWARAVCIPIMIGVLISYALSPLVNRLHGPTLAKKRITLGVLDEINGQIQRYLLVHIATSVLVGVATWLAFLWMGVEHAAIWGVAAAVLNTVPYIGPVLITGGTTVVALLQFGTIAEAALVGAVALLITSLEGRLLTPWLTGRASRMNPVAVFVGVLLWGWLWGVWGLLLAVPIIMVVKAICDQIDDLKPVGELLGE